MTFGALMQQLRHRVAKDAKRPFVSDSEKRQSDGRNETSGQSNLTQGRIAAADGRFNS